MVVTDAGIVTDGNGQPQYWLVPIVLPVGATNTDDVTTVYRFSPLTA